MQDISKKKLEKLRSKGLEFDIKDSYIIIKREDKKAEGYKIYCAFNNSNTYVNRTVIEKIVNVDGCDNFMIGFESGSFNNYVRGKGKKTKEEDKNDSWTEEKYWLIIEREELSELMGNAQQKRGKIISEKERELEELIKSTSDENLKSEKKAELNKLITENDYKIKIPLKDKSYNCEELVKELKRRLPDIEIAPVAKAGQEVKQIPSKEQIFSVLKKQKQIILYGPPGTGKTTMAEIVAEIAVIEGGEKKNINDYIKKVQFHPSYSYYDFVEGIEAEEEGFRPKSKIFREFVENAEKNENKKYVLIIDEINRADISAVLGELLLGLEYRKTSISTSIQKDKPLKIPDNLYIIGTMNSADKTLTQIDYALRRRFAFINIPSGYTEEIKKSINDGNVEYCEVALKGGQNGTFCNKLFIAVRNHIFLSVAQGVDPEDIMPGISYFIYHGGDEKKEHLLYKINYELIPLLDDYAKNGMFVNRKKIDKNDTLVELIKEKKYGELLKKRI